MFLVFFNKKHLNDFMRVVPVSRFNAGSTHDNIYKIIKSYDDYKTKYNAEFYDNLKRILRDYRYVLVDDMKQIEEANLAYNISMKLPEGFPCEAILDKKKFDHEKNKIEIHHAGVWHIVEELKIIFEKLLTTSNASSATSLLGSSSPSSKKNSTDLSNTLELLALSKGENIVEEMDMESEQDVASGCTNLKNWFGHCYALLFSKNNEYSPLPGSEVNSKYINRRKGIK